MQKLALLIALTLVTGVLPARAAGMALTGIPSDAASSDKELWRRVMVEFYGKYDKQQKCWIGKSGGKRYCMRPHTLDKVSAGGATHYFIAIGGHPIEDGYDYHACSGTLGLLVLSDADKRLGIVARNGGYEDFGGFGTVPAEENFDVHRIGAPDSFAWTIVDGWMGQGISTTSTSIFGILGDQVKNLGHLPHSFSDEGNCENGVNMMTQEKCTSVSFDAVYEADGGTARFGAIQLNGTGTWKGMSFSQSYRATFDDQAMAYRVPAGFPEDFSP